MYTYLLGNECSAALDINRKIHCDLCFHLSHAFLHRDLQMVKSMMSSMDTKRLVVRDHRGVFGTLQSGLTAEVGLVQPSLWVAITEQHLAAVLSVGKTTFYGGLCCLR